MRTVTICSMVALTILLTSCATTVTLDDGEYVPPLLPSFDVRVGKSFTGNARSATLTVGKVHIEVGEISIGRLDRLFDSMFRQTDELEMWPPWQTRDLSHLDGVVEVDNVFGSFEQSRSVQINLDACLYDRDGSKVGCWAARVHEAITDSPLSCMFNSQGCVTPFVDTTIDSATGILLLEISKDPVVTAWVDRVRSRTACERGDGCIGMLWWPSNSQSANSAFARDIQHCLSRHISKALPGRPLIEMQRIRKLLYPLMERSTEPKTEEEFVDLLNRQDVHRRMLAYGITHVVAFSGSTDVDEHSGHVFCGAGYGGGGCLGLAWWHKETSLRAVTIDLATKGNVKDVSAVDKGTSLLPAFVLPIPIPAATQEDACRNLAEQIVALVDCSQ